MTSIFTFFSPQYLKRLFRYLLIGVSSFIVLLILIDQAISFYVRQHIYTDVNELPYRPYGVVLGTSKYFDKNTLNLFYHNRLLAAYEVFATRKIDYLLLSGDNRTSQYNEPRSMFKDLRKMGIPQEFMYMDFAGFRTLDSVIRAEQVFKAHSFTIITQKFHCERALFIAKYYDIDAICFVAEYPHGHYFVRFREFFARILAILDLLMEKEPHFLGTPEPLPPPASVPIAELELSNHLI
ncbi:protein SanA [Pasteurella canis]|uniref:Protein SanA n=1 Tax=Pasteurella canis TaxID=753 RepID=A0A379ETA0_9PAST|nr:ElyC/SanA/YdcF family protein [Pasteurella canis]MXN87905.1 vancomycin high temperature exclusion protein [Pasteurella canis]SUC09607.1 protein SanA [Pasteurella canis]